MNFYYVKANIDKIKINSSSCEDGINVISSKIEFNNIEINRTISDGIDMDFSNDMTVGEYFIIECWRKLDPTVWTDIYNDFFLKKYATALIKKQWGQNLIKFNGVTMLGGVTMNGEMIFSQAQEEIIRLEEEMRLTYEMPVDFAVG